MLLPREQIYKDKTFDELLEDDFTKELFDSISSSEGVIIWRDSISNFISAEEQYAVLFNTCYYIVNEIRLNPRPHLRIEEYESFIETLKWSSFLLMPDCKELIFTIIYYIVSEVLRFDDKFCRRIRLRASQEIYNLIFFKILYFEGRNLVEKILPQPELDTQVLACNTISKSDLDVSPFWGNSGMGTIIDDLELQISELKNKIKEQEKCIAKQKIEIDKHAAECANKSDEWVIDKEDIIKQAGIDANRKLVEQLIIYAEREQKNTAREIRIALTTKMANGYIAGDTLSEEWKQRLENLGREKPRNDAMNFNNAVGTVVAHADNVTLQYQGQ